MAARTSIDDERKVIELFIEQSELIGSRETVREQIKLIMKLKKRLEKEEREWTEKVIALSIGRISDMTGISVHVIGRLKREYDIEVRIRKEYETGIQTE
jgi:CRISPR/Cas system CMR subunit Cmr4 (Cas7 group RAMP superfamily)